MTAPIATLRECPFCGGEASRATCTIVRDRNIEGDKGTFSGHYVNCIVCGADNRGIAEGSKTPEQAAERWNRRFVPSEKGRISDERIKQLVSNAVYGGMNCADVSLSECVEHAIRTALEEDRA